MEAVAPTPHEVETFYDEFGRKQLRNFVYGNARISAAVDLVVSLLDGGPGRLLCFGCGVGVEANMLTDRLPEYEILGVDISGKSIDIARQLFESDQLKFQAGGVESIQPSPPFDVVTLVDVYEHIPRADWPNFNRSLGELLSSNGIVVLSAPTPAYQTWLHENNPAGLQIIDESVALSDIEVLADDLDATVTYYCTITMGMTHQYEHAVLVRNLLLEKYTPPPPVPAPRNPFQRLGRRVVNRLRPVCGWKTETPPEEIRRKFVKARVGIDVD